MKKFSKKICVLTLALLIVFTSSFSVSNASSNLAQMSPEALRKKIINKTIYRLAGEPTLYDKETGAEFNPSTGKILNIKDFQRLPGGPTFIKKKGKFKEFNPSDYKNLTYTATVTNYKKTKSKKGWTVSMGIKVQAKNKPKLYKTYSINISYDKSEDSYYVSGTITKTKIRAAGKKQKALVTLGVTPKNQFGITGKSNTAGLSAGMFDISASTNGTITLSSSVNGGAAITVGKSKTTQTFCIPIK